jgi:hypothetical protein
MYPGSEESGVRVSTGRVPINPGAEESRVRVSMGAVELYAGGGAG